MAVSILRKQKTILHRLKMSHLHCLHPTENIFVTPWYIKPEPVPSPPGTDPYNWPIWKPSYWKLINLIPVLPHLSTNCCPWRFSPFWKPLSQPYGRRPIFLLSTILSLVFNVGCAKSPTYASMAACRALTAFSISSTAAIRSALVAVIFFKGERGRYMGIWILMVTLGVPVGPLSFGFAVNHTGYRWVFWVLAITNGVQFILYIIFGPEARYVGGSTVDSSADFKNQYLSFRRIDPTPLTFSEFIHPLTMAKYPSVTIPAVVYAMVFLFGSVLITVEVPQLLQGKFGLNAEHLGLQFLGVMVGTVLGEQIGSPVSDYRINRRALHVTKAPEPGFRLWLSYPGIILTIADVIVFLVCTQKAPDGHWVVSPIVDTAVAAFGNQLVTTVMVTYAIDGHPDDAGSVGVFITSVRQAWGSIGPFWGNVGIAASSGLSSALILACSLLPTITVHLVGRKWRWSVSLVASMTCLYLLVSILNAF
ncbi:putative MFS transporter [Aspergillus alliaceus]|uniref:putative MFS transporter n=1 Tax=Petromyces alliaceus TaxID=209559 RepID=UPI0012A4D9CC|nr:major facilitator superfamily domain-containing protein [Aspergillus alliaceus]KAB8231818.1 major facilitator superfamily domain-containing protein [Aspergillus alliaceus]